jgi:peptide/nickel transport system substrate-binding protein
VFGRRFELVAFPWLSGIRPPCNLYTSVSIPDEENGWRGNNNTGWSDPLFDEICGAAQRVAWDSDAYREQHQAAVVLFSEALPIIPLFSYLNVAAVQPHVRNFRMDSTQASELWNLYELTIDPVAD